MTRVIRRERLHRADPRYGRNIQHDSLSRRYPFDTTGIAVKSVRWPRRVPVWDQKALGSCTGNAGLGCLGTGPFFPTVSSETVFPFTEAGAVKVYSAATAIDDAPGQYPPTDTGSDGLSVAKVLQKAGLISGYQHTFTLDDALKALQVVPLIVGTVFLADMEEPNSAGLVSVSGSELGGHEYIADEFDSQRGWVGFTNSWGADFGIAGRFYMQAEDFDSLLQRDGDIIAFTPIDQPSPEPSPDPSEKFAEILKPWATLHHSGEAAKVASAGREWILACDL